MLLISLPAIAQINTETGNGTADRDPPQPDLSVYDEREITVTIGQMRNSLWYYENYLIQLDVVDSQAVIIEGQAELIAEWESAFNDELALRVSAEYRAQQWGIFGFTAGAFGVLMLVLEFIRELQKTST